MHASRAQEESEPVTLLLRQFRGAVDQPLNVVIDGVAGESGYACSLASVLGIGGDASACSHAPEYSPGGSTLRPALGR